MAKLKSTALLIFAALAANVFAAIPVRWTVDTFRVKPLVYECYHGETLDLAAEMTAYGDPLDLAGKTAHLFWQTNGMASVYWQTNAEVRVGSAASVTNALAAVFSGAFDTGADTVTGFIGVDGENYRAAFTLKFRASPGFAPNALPLPATVIDFAATTVLNPESSPFVVKGGEGGVTLSQVTNVSQNVTSNIVTKAYVEGLGIEAGVSASAVTNIAESASVTNAGAVAEAKAYADAAVAEKRDLTNMVASVSFGEWGTPAGITSLSQSLYEMTGLGWMWSIEYYDENFQEYYYLGVVKGPGTSDLWNTKKDAETATEGYYDGFGGYVGKTYRAAVTNYLATTADFTTNNAALVGTITNNAASKATEATVAQWENYWKGDRVRLSVTNYYGNTSGELPRLRLEEFDHSTTSTVDGVQVISHFFRIVWDEEARHTNYQAQVDTRIENISNEVMTAAWQQTTAQLAGKAPKNWGDVTSGGVKAPENTVWMTAPNTVFAGGTEYAHVAVGEGTICVLTDNGAPVYTEGEEGTFRFKDDSGQYYFGFDIRESYTLGCRTDGISVSGGMVSLTYDLISADNPEILYCTNLLTGTWNTATVTWEENPPVAGTKICYINVGTNPQGFYKAQINYAGGAKFCTNMMADFTDGIAATNESGQTSATQLPVYPVITSTGVVWRVKWSN